MMPSGDDSYHSRDAEEQGSYFRDDEDSRPPNVPRDGSSRDNRNEQADLQRFVIDWDAAAGYLSKDDFAYSGYSNAHDSGVDYQAQMQDLYEDLIGSIVYRNVSFHRSRSSEPELASAAPALAGSRTPAVHRLPRV